MQKSHVARFDSSTPEYTRAFGTFLAHTDQKRKAMAWLEREVDGLPRRQTAVDSGAGAGTLAVWLAERFDTVIGLEPNPSLAAEFRKACPAATLIGESILNADVAAAADFILCSHVFYYIPRGEWEANARQLIGWLAPGGTLVVALQNPGTDCSRMIAQFLDLRFDLRELADVARRAPGGPYDVRVETVAAEIRTDDLATACAIAEFLLNSLPMPDPPRWADLEEYVKRHFPRPGGRYQFSCDQDFLRVARGA